MFVVKEKNKIKRFYEERAGFQLCNLEGINTSYLMRFPDPTLEAIKHNYEPRIYLVTLLI